eukprot:784002_1
MSTFQPTLSDPDKLGLLLQCRQKMDELNPQQLQQYSHSILGLLSAIQVKKLLFVGLNTIKSDIEYTQLFQMKTVINQVLNDIEKAKKLKRQSKSEAMCAHQAIPIIPKDASLTKVIPFDIISNNICTFLTMSSITQLAQCDRKFAVICQTPTSINNLMRRHDPYRYSDVQDVSYDPLIDGHYIDMDQWNMHRIKNVQRLSITIPYLNYNVSKFNTFHRVKHLTFYDTQGGSYDILPYAFNVPYTGMILMPFLESICFVNSQSLQEMLYFLKEYRENPRKNDYYNSIIYQLKSVAFIDFYAHENLLLPISEYGNIVNLVLPSQPNRLEVLKLENTFFEQRTYNTKYCVYNKAMADIERITSSLANIKAFVYRECTQGDIEFDRDDDLFLKLTTVILSNLLLFPKLKSLHVHEKDALLLGRGDGNSNTDNVYNNIDELCLTVLMNTFKYIVTTRPLTKLYPNLEKLCLVIDINPSDGDADRASDATLFMRWITHLLDTYELKVLQIVALLQTKPVNDDVSFCQKRIRILNTFVQKFVTLFHSLGKHTTVRGLIFKLHVKSCHVEPNDSCTMSAFKSGDCLETFANGIQSMVFNYLSSCPLGKIQFKWSWNTHNHNEVQNKLEPCVSGLRAMFHVNTKSGGTFLHKNGYYDSDKDYRQYAISACKRDIADQTVEHNAKWKADCRYCCNTPWV